MWRFSTILFLGFGFCAEPASARNVKVYPLTVSIHELVKSTLDQAAVEAILARASDLLQGHGSAADTSNNCSVGFKLKGRLTTFSSAPADIGTLSDLEKAHSVPADVKVVRSINFCVNEFSRDGFIGCSWRPNRNVAKTIIVTPPDVMGDDLQHIVWVHEFGHTTGLLHRTQSDEMHLMTACEIELFNRQINANECRHFVAGPVQHFPSNLGRACPLRSSGKVID